LGAGEQKLFRRFGLRLCKVGVVVKFGSVDR
jgi:hypothetical protein